MDYSRRRAITVVVGAVFCALCGLLCMHMVGASSNTVNASCLSEEELERLCSTTATAETSTSTTSSTTSITTTTSTTSTTVTTTAITTTSEAVTETEEYKINRDAEDYVWYYTDTDVAMLASTISNEIGGSDNYAQLTAVGWCVCNRVDSARWVEDTIGATVSRPGQFDYHGGFVYEGKCYDIASTVLQDWNDEKNYPGYVGPSRSIAPDYLNFWGDGVNNHFSNDYNEIIPQ